GAGDPAGGDLRRGVPGDAGAGGDRGVAPGRDEGGDVGRRRRPGAEHDPGAAVDEGRVGQRDRPRSAGAVTPAVAGAARPGHQPSPSGAGAAPSPAGGRASAAMADSTPLTNRGESSVPNRRASTTASLRITAFDRSGTSNSS